MEKARGFVSSRRAKEGSSGETKYTLPWIWYKPGIAEDGQKICRADIVPLGAGLKCDSRAHGRVVQEPRSRAELATRGLVTRHEEMGRVLRFNESLAQFWDNHCYEGERTANTTRTGPLRCK